jgi:hypothetical protein
LHDYRSKVIGCWATAGRPPVWIVAGMGHECPALAPVGLREIESHVRDASDDEQYVRVNLQEVRITSWDARVQYRDLHVRVRETRVMSGDCDVKHREAPVNLREAGVQEGEVDVML